MEQKGMEYNDIYDAPILISPSLWNRMQRYIRSYDVIFAKLCPNCKELDLAEIHYYRINQILLSIVQLWPYKWSMLTKIKGIFIIILLMSLMFFQLTTFLTFKYTTDFFVWIFSYCLLGLIAAYTYCYFYINLYKIKQMWRDISDIWNNIKYERERNIMRWYLCLSEFFTIGLILFFGTSLGIYTCMLFSPLILDTIYPLNESRPVFVYAQMEYFIDGEKYYYPILCHWLVCLCLEAIAIIATTTFLVLYVLHICGLLSIACYRIGQVIDGSVNLSNLGKRDCNPVQKLHTAVDAHREALKYAELFVSSLASFFIPISIILAASLILNLFRLFRVITIQDVSGIIPAFLLCIGHFVTLFVGTYIGQEITDHDAKIFKKAYEVQWYAAPADVQKLLLLLMKITTRTYSLNVGNIYIASIETFNNISNMCLSYFTIIYSIMEW